MKPHMLQSQFETLEEPTNRLTIDVSMSVYDVVQEILNIWNEPIRTLINAPPFIGSY